MIPGRVGPRDVLRLFLPSRRVRIAHRLPLPDGESHGGALVFWAIAGVAIFAIAALVGAR